MGYKPDYEHIRCDCGGVIGTWNREDFTCDKCDKRFSLYKIRYDRLLINDKTRWIFPVLDKEDFKE